MSEQLNEVFESEGSLPVVNLNPKAKVPQVWKIGDVDTNIVVRLFSYLSEGDAVKQVKLGDKYAHVVIMSLSEKGNLAELKNGLGPAPIDAINTIFNTVYEQVKALRMDAVLFRFPTKKLKGRGQQLQTLLARLVSTKTGGRFKVLSAMYQFTGKHTYVMMVRKNANIEDIKGIPNINTELYTKVDSDVGEVYVSKKTGEKVTKETAIAGSIAAVEEKRKDKPVIARTKISRRAIAAAQSISTAIGGANEYFQKFENDAARFSRPATRPETPALKELKAMNDSPVALDKAVRTLTSIGGYGTGVGGQLLDSAVIPKAFLDTVNNDVKVKMETRLKGIPLTSVKALTIFSEIMSETIDTFKYNWEKKFEEGNGHLNYMAYEETKTRSWNLLKSKFIARQLQSYSNVSSEAAADITFSRKESDTQYTPDQKRGIREYVGSGYIDINALLLGTYNPRTADVLSEKEAAVAIERLDSAFENGDRLPEGITLYRSQLFPGHVFESMVKTKVFYFRNFVSTSLYPIIFGNFKTDAGVGLLPDADRKPLNVVGTSDEEINPATRKEGNDDVPVNKILVSAGLAIDGAHKINVVFPGGGLAPANEREVILPRGTLMKINKIVDASSEYTPSKNNKFIQMEVMTSDQLDEAVIYDGDVLMETGEVVAMTGEIESDELVSFSSFVEKTSAPKGLKLLASLMDLESVPFKFVQG